MLSWFKRINASLFHIRETSVVVALDLLDKEKRNWRSRYMEHFLALDNLLQDIPELAQAQHVVDRLAARRVCLEALQYIAEKRQIITENQFSNSSDIKKIRATLANFERQFEGLLVQRDVLVGKAVPVRSRKTKSMRHTQRIAVTVGFVRASQIAVA